ncbi:hypothetical protein FDZ58_04090 [Ehrlichia ruminantium]|uniref:hypothetical protein n=1 Tax=Ehrlichia ruminantium TaxID=779 RepID=UPI0015DCE5C7|nr:hypothetical protein [Ehrlichia ruminantium]QLK50810.1 hypothetical protein FDZ68_04085 [Ehrlichia ruminantium]QLK51732.1 hypothetical protein FDZ66_04085 [Ehrlichia ruminantium]QLK53571.1 hypothetical protein FDZ64_04085 [Ehrlichia ruminantium]QLK59066.1 hypothetical protein FDZ58_04090 [Ehrlichia ruminantium]
MLATSFVIIYIVLSILLILALLIAYWYCNKKKKSKDSKDIKHSTNSKENDPTSPYNIPISEKAAYEKTVTNFTTYNNNQPYPHNQPITEPTIDYSTLNNYPTHCIHNKKEPHPIQSISQYLCKQALQLAISQAQHIIPLPPKSRRKHSHYILFNDGSALPISERCSGPYQPLSPTNSVIMEIEEIEPTKTEQNIHKKS